MKGGAGCDGGAPAPSPGDLDQVDHKLPRILWGAKAALHRTLAK